MPHLERALELDPQLPEALGVMGLTLEARGNYEDALEHYEKALAINPSLTDARNWYSNALDNVGRPGDALREMERAYELDPLSVLTLSNYSVHLVSRRDFDKAEPVVNRLAQVDETRGVGLRSWMRILQGRAADGVADALRAIDRDARDPRLRANTAENLMRFGFSDAAINIWPFPDDLFGVIAEGTDLEYSLELAQKRFNNDPNNLEKLSDLAWANWNARDTDTAVELVRRYLDKLDPQRRSLDFANMILAFEAGRVGDMDEQRELLVPLNNFLDRLLASGVDDGRIHAGKAWLSYMLGQQALALEHMEKAMFRSVLAVETVTRWYEYAGWDKLPEWTALQERHRDYMQAEGAKLMAMACGPDGFEAWQPSAEACGRASPPSAPN